MKFSHKVLILASIGFGLGVIVGVMLSAFFSTLSIADGNLYLCSEALTRAVGDPLLAFVIEALLSGLNGAVAMGLSSVYSIEEWSVAKCTAVHYFPTMTVCFIVAFSLRWILIGDIAMILIMFSMMTVAYFIIWLSFYISYRIQLKKINRELEEFKLSECEGTK